MSRVLYNKLEQPIKYKGQLSRADTVLLHPTRSFHYLVIELEEDTGKITHAWDRDVHTIKFKEGTGWVWVSV